MKAGLTHLAPTDKKSCKKINKPATPQVDVVKPIYIFLILLSILLLTPHLIFFEKIISNLNPKEIMKFETARAVSWWMINRKAAYHFLRCWFWLCSGISLCRRAKRRVSMCKPRLKVWWPNGRYELMPSQYILFEGQDNNTCASTTFFVVFSASSARSLLQWVCWYFFCRWMK